MRLKSCDRCGKQDRQKKLAKINGYWFCKKCKTEKRQEHREETKRVYAGIRPRKELEKEWAEKRKQKEKERKQKELKQKQDELEGVGKPYKPIEKKSNSINTYSYLQRQEKQLLFKKYLNSGATYEEADQKVKDVVKELEDYREELKKQKKSEKEINRKFQEEFAKLVGR